MKICFHPVFNHSLKQTINGLLIPGHTFTSAAPCSDNDTNKKKPYTNKVSLVFFLPISAVVFFLSCLTSISNLELMSFL